MRFCIIIRLESAEGLQSFCQMEGCVQFARVREGNEESRSFAGSDAGVAFLVGDFRVK